MNIKNIECQPIKPPLNFGSARKTVKPSDKIGEKQTIQELTNKQSMRFGLTASGVVIGLVLLLSYICSKNSTASEKIKTGIASVIKKPLLMLENLPAKRKNLHTGLVDLNKIILKPL